MTETQLKADIQKALDQLGIPRWRMQAGGYRGRTRGLPKGTPDILASPCVTIMGALFPCWLWIEVKLPKGKLSVEQVEFADKIKKRGHHWLLAKSIDDVLNWLKERKAR